MELVPVPGSRELPQRLTKFSKVHTDTQPDDTYREIADANQDRSSPCP